MKATARVGARAHGGGDAALAGLILAAALAIAGGPSFANGVPALPYRWVRPPANLRGGNVTPASGQGTLALRATGVDAGSVATDDAQAFVVLARHSVAPRAGEAAVRITITPLDPRGLPGLPPGLHIDGNAYRIEAVYAGSGEVVTLTKPATVVLQYPIHGLQLFRLSDATWAGLETVRFQTSLQVFAFTDRPGIFAAVGAGRPAPWYVSSWPYLAATVLLLLLSVPLLRRAARSRDGAGGNARTPGASPPA